MSPSEVDAPVAFTGNGSTSDGLTLPGWRRRRTRVRPAGHITEPLSLTDARARVDRRAQVHPAQQWRHRVTGVPAAAIAADVVALVLAAVWVGGGAINPIVFGVAVLVTRAAVRLYRLRLSLTVLDDLPRAAGSVVAATGIALAVTYLTHHAALPGSEPLERAGSFLLISLVLQTVVFAVARRIRRSRPGGRRTLIVGAGRMGRTVASALTDHPELGLTPIGFADPDITAEAVIDGTPLLLSDMDRLAETIKTQDIDTAILAFPGTGDAHVDTVIAVHQTGCNIMIVPTMFELHHDGPDVERIRGVPLLRLRTDPTLRLSWWVKRAVDVAAGLFGLLVLSVPLAVVALLILIDSGRPILFWQERVGLDGRTFRLCKFRSMRPANEAESRTNWNIANDPRVGKVGKLLRRTSIDEVPQLWNIVRGEMSLVGPRPERPTFVEKFSAEHDRYWARHRVPVGLTGLAQVNGLRGDTSIRERARYDNYYIANWSLWLDVKVLMLTTREVLGGRGR